MAKLTKDQIDFLTRYGVSPDSVFDATGLPTSVWKVEAKKRGMRFVFGVSPCQKARHTIRTRAGHCFQCNPENKSYITRHESAGFVYIAQSKSASLVKVGSTTDLRERGRALNDVRYGGARDWRIVLRTAWIERAGEIESRTQGSLRAWAFDGFYEKAGVRVDCRELFKSDLRTTRAALEKQLPKDVMLSTE
jgi:hypothetical protein